MNISIPYIPCTSTICVCGGGGGSRISTDGSQSTSSVPLHSQSLPSHPPPLLSLPFSAPYSASAFHNPPFHCLPSHLSLPTVFLSINFSPIPFNYRLLPYQPLPPMFSHSRWPLSHYSGQSVAPLLSHPSAPPSTSTRCPTGPPNNPSGAGSPQHSFDLR